MPGSGHVVAGKLAKISVVRCWCFARCKLRRNLGRFRNCHSWMGFYSHASRVPGIGECERFAHFPVFCFGESIARPHFANLIRSPFSRITGRPVRKAIARATCSHFTSCRTQSFSAQLFRLRTAAIRHCEKTTRENRIEPRQLVPIVRETKSLCH